MECRGRLRDTVPGGGIRNSQIVQRPDRLPPADVLLCWTAYQSLDGRVGLLYHSKSSSRLFLTCSSELSLEDTLLSEEQHHKARRTTWSSDCRLRAFVLRAKFRASPLCHSCRSYALDQLDSVLRFCRFDPNASVDTDGQFEGVL